MGETLLQDAADRAAAQAIRDDVEEGEMALRLEQRGLLEDPEDPNDIIGVDIGQLVDEALAAQSAITTQTNESVLALLAILEEKKTIADELVRKQIEAIGARDKLRAAGLRASHEGLKVAPEVADALKIITRIISRMDDSVSAIRLEIQDIELDERVRVELDARNAEEQKKAEVNRHAEDERKLIEIKGEIGSAESELRTLLMYQKGVEGAAPVKGGDGADLPNDVTFNRRKMDLNWEIQQLNEQIDRLGGRRAWTERGRIKLTEKHDAATKRRLALDKELQQLRDDYKTLIETVEAATKELKFLILEYAKLRFGAEERLGADAEAELDSLFPYAEYRYEPSIFNKACGPTVRISEERVLGLGNKV